MTFFHNKILTWFPEFCEKGHATLTVNEFSVRTKANLCPYLPFVGMQQESSAALASDGKMANGVFHRSCQTPGKLVSFCFSLFGRTFFSFSVAVLILFLASSR